jgi:glutamate synthase domain-containing protein 3
VVYVYDPAERLPLRLNDQLVAAAPLDEGAEAEVHALLERHVRFTDSDLGLELLASWETVRTQFRRVAPKAEVATIESAAEGTRGGVEEKEPARAAV